MSDKLTQTPLETGSYKPDNLETGSDKPDELETGSHKPEQLETSSNQLETDTDSVKSEPRALSARKQLLQNNVYPADFRNRMAYSYSVPFAYEMHELDYFSRMDYSEEDLSETMLVTFSEGPLSGVLPYYAILGKLDDFVIELTYNHTSKVYAPEVRTVNPFQTPDVETFPLPCLHDVDGDKYFIPSQQFCVSRPRVLPELTSGDTLRSLSARKLLDWPCSWKPIPSTIRTGGSFYKRHIPGPFHLISLLDDIYTEVIIQATDFEVYCLSCHNPRLFSGLACTLDGNSYYFKMHVRHNLQPIVNVLRLTRSPEAVWATLFYGYNTLNRFFLKECDLVFEFWYSFADMIKDNPRVLAWKEKNLRRLLTYCKYEEVFISFPESEMPRRCPKSFEKLHRKIMKKRFPIRLQGEEVALHGLFDFLRSNQTSQAPSLIASLKNIGKFTGNVNGVIDFFNKPPFDFLTNLLLESSTIIVGIFKDFTQFLMNPAKFVREFVNEVSTSTVAEPNVGVYESLFSIGCLGLAYATHDSNPTLSVTLFFVTTYSTTTKFLTDHNAARKVAILATLMYMSVMRALQSLSAPISLQASTDLTGLLVTACGGIACLIAGVKTYGTSSSIFEYLAKNTKDVGLASRGMLSLVTCLEFILDTVRKGVEFLVGETTFYKTMVKCTVTSKDLQDYIVFSLSKTPEILSTTLTMDENARKEWERMCKLHDHFLSVFAAGKTPTENHIGYSMYSKAYSRFTSLKDEYIKIKDSLDYYRPEPFMVWLWGSPGTGKTWCRDSLVSNLYRWHKKVDATIPDAKSTGLLYVRNPADKYMSSYVGQFAVAYDDVGQNRQTDNPEFLEIMSVGSTNQVRLNMADLAEKGRLFSSKVVIMASNTKDVNSNNLILKEEAFNRRRHIVVEVLRPLNPEATISTSECDFSQVALHLTDPRTGGEVARFPATGYGPSKETWMSFYQWLAPRYVQHVETQKALLEDKMKQLEATTNGTDNDLIFDYDKVTEISEGDLTIEEAVFSETDNVQVQADDGVEVRIRMPDLPSVVSLARQRAFIKGIKNKADRFKMACLVYPELFDASEVFRINRNELAKDSLKRTYARFVKEDLDEMLLIVSPPVSKQDPEELAKAWELYTACRDGVEIPWLKYLTWAGVALSLFGAYKMFMSFNSGESPELQAYCHDPKAPPVPKVVVHGYDHAPQAPPKNTVVVQSTTEDLLPLYRKAIYRVNCILEDEENPRFRSINFVHLAYDLFLAPKHFFKGLVTKKFRMTGECNTYREVEVKDEDLTPVDGLDFYIVRIKSVNFGKNLINHFPTRDEVKAIIAFNSMVVSWNQRQNTPVMNYTGEAKRWDIPVDITDQDEVIHFPEGYRYGWQSKPGDCGSMLIATDNACCSKIMGIHFGYDSSKRQGLSVILTRERLAKYIDKLAPIKIEVKDPVIEVQPSEVPISLMSEDRPLFDYLGVVKGAPSQPRVHKNLFRSPTYGQIYPPVKDLSVLSCNDPRLDDEHKGPPDILVRGVRDFSYDTRSWPDYAVEYAKDCLRYEFSQYTERIPRQVCSEEWAINGTWCGDARVEFTEPLRLDTSSGFGLDGKKLRHFDTSDPKNIVVSNPVLRQMIDEQWNEWMDGSTKPCIWTHATKSEPLKLSKIVTGNTRTFCVAQTSFLINVKRLFGAWITAMKSSKIKSFSCLGMDPESGDWTDLYHALRDVSPVGIDMDFFKFDRTAVTWQLARAVVEEINTWYDDEPEFKRARFIAMNDMINSYCLVGEHLTRKNRGNPSGNPITTELNNCINFMMLAMVYAIIARKYSAQNLSTVCFRRNVAARVYGDDIIFSVSLRDLDWFTPYRIESVYKYFGVPVTPADKSDRGLEYKPIEQLTFLKRSFLPYDNPLFPWQAALSQDSIRSMIDFYRLAPNNGTAQDAVLVNMHQSLEFAHHWGKEFFDNHLSLMERWLADAGWPALAVSYEMFDIRYKIKLGLEQTTE